MKRVRPGHDTQRDPRLPWKPLESLARMSPTEDTSEEEPPPAPAQEPRLPGELPMEQVQSLVDTFFDQLATAEQRVTEYSLMPSMEMTRLEPAATAMAPEVGTATAVAPEVEHETANALLRFPDAALKVEDEAPKVRPGPKKTRPTSRNAVASSSRAEEPKGQVKDESMDELALSDLEMKTEELDGAEFATKRELRQLLAQEVEAKAQVKEQEVEEPKQEQKREPPFADPRKRKLEQPKLEEAAPSVASAPSFGVVDYVADSDEEEPRPTRGAPRPGGDGTDAPNANRGGPWSGWLTVRTFLSRHRSSRWPLRHFLMHYWRISGDPPRIPHQPEEGYRELNDPQVRRDVIE